MVLVRMYKYFWCSVLCCQFHLIFLTVNDRVHLMCLKCDCISDVFVVDLVDCGFCKIEKCLGHMKTLRSKCVCVCVFRQAESVVMGWIEFVHVNNNNTLSISNWLETSFF